MEVFYTNLASVLNTTPELAEQLVLNYNKGDLEFFQTYFTYFPTAVFAVNNSKNSSVNMTLFVEEENIGYGGFAAIKKNRAKPFVYKTFINRYSEEKRLQFIKPIFKEAIIQTLLQSDPKNGKHICKLYKVYRVGNECVFQIEPLETTIEKYFETNPTHITKVIVKLLEIINYFKTTYGFSHNDLKLDNVMTVKQGNAVAGIKLIDFGLSSVQFDAVAIGKASKTRSDMQYLFYSLSKHLELEPNEFSNLIDTMLELPTDTPIQTYIDMLLQEQAGAEQAEAVQKKAGGFSRRNKTRKNRKFI